MSSWSCLNNSALKVVEFYWRGQLLGRLSPVLAKLWQAPQKKGEEEPDDFERAQDYFYKESIFAGYNWAIGKLSAQNQSKLELRQKLKLRGLDSSCIDSVIRRLEEAHVLDECYLAESIEEKAKRQHKSLRASYQKLALKGLKSSSVSWQEAHLQEKESVRYWLNRWAKSENLREKPEKYWARLAGRGFDFTAIQEAWETWLKDFYDENSK